jgi:uncharacterized protein (DUF1697 family)
MGHGSRLDSVRYVAFLRGINVGGNKPVRMAELGAAFEKLGLRNVRTVLTSGNVLFDAPASSFERLPAMVRAGLKRTLGLDAAVAIRTLEQVRRLVSANHFADVRSAARAQLYITFLAEDAPTEVSLPDRPPTDGIRTARVSAGEVASVVKLSPGRGTTDLMSAIDRQFGPKATTRNWNTVGRVLAADGQ